MPQLGHDHTNKRTLFGSKSVSAFLREVWPHIDDLHISKCFRKMPTLRVLNNLNLPEATSAQPWVPTDYTFDGLVKLIMDMIYSNMEVGGIRQKKPRTIALGAPLYTDVRVGADHFPRNTERDFLRLGVYIY